LTPSRYQCVELIILVDKVTVSEKILDGFYSAFGVFVP